jgi:hypothetical protein
MHGHSNWINLVLSGAMFLVTGVLAWATWKYMRFTKRMADSIELQSKILHEEHELAMKPDIATSFFKSVPDGDNFKYTYFMSNNSRRTSILKKIKANLWKGHDPDNKFLFDISDRIMNISPLAVARVDLAFSFSAIQSIFPDITNLNQISMQPIFVIEDFNHRDIEFFDFPRKIGE